MLIFLFSFTIRSRRRNRRISDNESEFSGRSHNSHRKHRRHRSRSRRSGSENESRRRSSSNHSNRSHRSENRALSNASLELIDSEDQWLEAQRKQGGRNGVVHQAAVVKSSSATKKNTLSNTDTNHKRKHRKHK